jgi:hypothetical protein
MLLGAGLAALSEAALYREKHESTFTYTIPMSRTTPEGWWDSRYTHSMEGSQRAWEDRWQIGNHTYRTKDLMGRRI